MPRHKQKKKPFALKEIQIKQQRAPYSQKALMVSFKDGNGSFDLTEERIDAMKRTSGLLYSSEHEFLDSVIKQLESGRPLTEKQLSWLGKIIGRKNRLDAALAKPITVKVVGGFR